MRRIPLGVIFFGAVLVVTSLWQMGMIPAYAKYKMINPDVSERWLMLRYVVSYGLRVAGLVCGIGVICSMNMCRRVLLLLFIFSIVTLPLRHTYSSFFIYVKPFFHGPVTGLVSLNVFTWMNVLCRWVIDGVFAGAGIYYFTRPAIAAYFRQKE